MISGSDDDDDDDDGDDDDVYGSSADHCNEQHQSNQWLNYELYQSNQLINFDHDDLTADQIVYDMGSLRSDL